MFDHYVKYNSTPNFIMAQEKVGLLWTDHVFSRVFIKVVVGDTRYLIYANTRAAKFPFSNAVGLRNYLCSTPGGSFPVITKGRFLFPAFFCLDAR